MTFPSNTLLRGSLLILALGAAQVSAQTTINVGTNVLQNNVKRFGINLSNQDFYDSGQMLKNLVFTNPSFEGQIYQSTIKCGSGTSNSCVDANPYSGFTPSFWGGASYDIISGPAKGRSGTVCSFSGGRYPVDGGLFTFCDSAGIAPGVNDYMVVKITMPTNVGWPGGDWQTVVGGGVLTAETADLPPGTTGKQAALLTATTSNDSIGVNMFFDSTAGKTFVQLNGSYQLTYKAKGIAGSKTLGIKLDRANAGLTYINTTQALTTSWATYTVNFNATENGTAIGRVELSFTAVGPDTVELDDVSLVKTSTDPLNTTVFRDEVVTALQNLHPGVLRFWEDQLGESLDNLLADPQGRQRSAYTPYNGFDGTGLDFQTQTVKFGLTDFLQLAQKVGADPWIVVPSTFSTGEAYNLIDYLAGPSSTPYGAKRAAAGQSQPWTSVFHQIHLEFGNEEWNGGTFKGGAIETGDAYGTRATSIFTAMRGNGSYVPSSFDLIVNGQSTAPYNNQFIQQNTLNNDSFSIAPYMMYNITASDTVDHLFGTTFAEAEAFVTVGASAEGVSGGFITSEQTLVGKPIVTSEMNLSPSSGTITQSTLNGYATSVGGGIAVIDSMFQQLRVGVKTQNLYSLPGYIANTVQSPANSMFLWGAVVDMGVTNRVRPQYLALQLANSALGSNTQELQTTHGVGDPTDTQYNFGLNSVTLPLFHMLQSFAFSGPGTNSLVVFNVSPDFAQNVNFAGPNAPTGTVVMQRLTSANITDTNEFSTVVQNTSTTLSNFNAGATMSLPAYSMTVFTWGGSVSTVPVPNVVGLTQAAASTSITGVGLTVGTVTTASSGTIASGNVISESPAAGSSVLSGSAVNLTVSSGIGQVAVPNVVNLTQAAATTSITGAGLVVGTVTTASSGTIASGSVISESPAAGTLVNSGSAVNLVVSSGPAQVAVPNVVNLTQAAATTSITGAGLIAGTVTTAASTTIVIGNVISEAPAAGTLVNSGSAVNLVVSSGVAVPNVVGSTQAAATTSITGAGLIVGTVTTASSGTIASGSVISESPAAATAVNGGSAVNLVVSSGPAQVAVPNVVNLTQATATTSITGAGLTAGTVTTAASTTIVIGNVISESPAAGTLVNSGSAVNLVVSAGVLVPNVVGSTQAAATTSIIGAGLVAGTVTTVASSTVPSGSVVSESPAAGTAVNGGSAVDLVVSSGPGQVPVPNVVGSTQAAATTAITGVGLVVGTVTTASSLTVAIGNVISETPAAATSVNAGSAVNLVISLGTTVPNVVGSTQAAAQTAIAGAGLTVGTVTTASSLTVAIGNVISSSPAAGTAVSGGSAVAFVVSIGTTVPTVFGLTQAAAGTAITGSGLTVGTVTNAASTTVTIGNVISSTPTAGTAVSGGSAVALVISSGTTVPTLINLTQAAAQTAITGAGLTVGTVTTASSATVASGSVISSSPVAGTAVNGGTSVNLVVSTGLTVPNVVGLTQAAATSAITGASLILGSTTTASSTTVAIGNVISSSPAAGTTVSGGSAVNLVISSGTTVPTVVNLTQAAAGTALTGAGLVTGTTTTVASTTVAVGNVISSTPIAGTAVNGGSSVTLVISSGTPVPNVVGLTQAVATTTITGASLALGTVTTAASTTVASGNVISSTPAAGTAVNGGSAVALVISSGTAVPNVVNLTQAAATTAITTAGLTSGAVTTAASLTVAIGNVISSTPVAGTAVNPGTSVSLVVSSGTTVPNVVGSTQAAATTAITGAGLTVTVTNQVSTTVPTGIVISESPAAGTAASGGSAVALVVSSGPAPAAIISSVASYPVGDTTASILWTTDQNTNSLVKYGTTAAYGSSTILNTSMGLYHVVPLAGLNPGTTYHYSVTSVNAANVSSSSADYTFTTTGTAPLQFTAVTASAITGTSATITWTTDKAATSQVAYGPTITYGTLTLPNPAFVTAHTVLLTGLTPGTLYNYQVLSGNAQYPTGFSTNFTFSTTGATAPVISGVTVSGISNNTVTINWTTDQAASTQVLYGTTTAYGTPSPLMTALVTSHSVTLTGLTAGTLYDFTPLSSGSTGLAAAPAGNFTFTTTNTVGPPPVISSVASFPVGNTTATILWTTDVVTNALVKFGLTNAYGSQTNVDNTLTLWHAVPLTNLTPGTTYHFSVTSASASGTPASSTDYSFTTTGTAPSLQFTGVAASAITTTTATVSWTTSQAATTQLAYGTSASYGLLTSLNAAQVTAHTVNLTGLTPGTTYNFAAISTNPAGQSGNFTFTTANGGGVPPVISGVTSSAITSSSATISWTTDQGASTQVFYGLTNTYGSQSTLDSNLLTTHTVTLGGLTPGTTYNYSPASANGFGAATAVNFTFATAVATTPIPIITNVASWPVADTTASILWVTDQATSSQVKYGTTPALGSQTTIKTSLDIYHVMPLTGLTPGTTYYFSVISTNSSSVTATSANSSFTTSGIAPAPSPVISGVTVTAITTTSATINWSTDQGSSTQVSYGTTTGYGLLSGLNNALVTTHSVTLTGLVAGTTYNFAPLSTNTTGGSAAVANHTFATTGVAGPPVISVVGASGVNSTSATITWTTDQPASTQVSYGTTLAYGLQSTLVVTPLTSHSVTLIGLTPGTLYNYSPLSTNTQGAALSTNFIFTTNSAVAGPTVSNVSFWGITGNSAVVTWSTDQLADTSLEYGISAALGLTTSVQPALSASHGVTLTGLLGNTTYYFRGKSTNSGGGVGYSTIYSFTTLDTGGPVISNIVATPAIGNAATVSWTVSKPATTQVEYGTNTGYGWWSPQSTGTSTALGWVPSGTIHYRIHSVDANGNQTVTADLTFIEP